MLPRVAKTYSPAISASIYHVPTIAETACMSYHLDSLEYRNFNIATEGKQR
jgi:hypothetical protein